jgi:hypothetical protein
MEELKTLLNTLGATPDDVAATLKAHRVQGVRNAVRTLNPVIRYLANHLRVDAFGLDVMQEDRVRLTHGNGKREEATIPEPVRLFLAAFNRGEYSDLELPPEKV